MMMKELGVRDAAYPFDWVYSAMTAVSDLLLCEGDRAWLQSEPEKRPLTWRNQDKAQRLGLAGPRNFYTTGDLIFPHVDFAADPGMLDTLNRHARAMRERIRTHQGRLLLFRVATDPELGHRRRQHRQRFADR